MKKVSAEIKRSIIVLIILLLYKEYFGKKTINDENKSKTANIFLYLINKWKND